LAELFALFMEGAIAKGILAFYSLFACMFCIAIPSVPLGWLAGRA